MQWLFVTQILVDRLQQVSMEKAPGGLGDVARTNLSCGADRDGRTLKQMPSGLWASTLSDRLHTVTSPTVFIMKPPCITGMRWNSQNGVLLYHLSKFQNPRNHNPTAWHFHVSLAALRKVHRPEAGRHP
jgi:hypothetical protein